MTVRMPYGSALSINVLLDFFERYVSSIEEPLLTAVHRISDELGYRQGEILAQIVEVVEEASTMAEQIAKMRETQNSDAHVTVTLTRQSAITADADARAVYALIREAADALELLRDGMAGGDLRGDDGGVQAIISFTLRVLGAALGQEMAALCHFARLLGEAGMEQPSGTERPA